jgi:hypothetical protein
MEASRVGVVQKLEQSLTMLANNLDKPVPLPEPSAATLAAEEEHILRCLGAALIMQWNTLPTELQRELFDSAGSMGELLDSDTLRGQIARFLQDGRLDRDPAIRRYGQRRPHRPRPREPGGPPGAGAEWQASSERKPHLLVARPDILPDVGADAYPSAKGAVATRRCVGAASTMPDDNNVFST